MVLEQKYQALLIIKIQIKQVTKFVIKTIGNFLKNQSLLNIFKN